MATNVFKVRSTKTSDIFTYRDDYNDEKVIEFPHWWGMTEEKAQIFIEENY